MTNQDAQMTVSIEEVKLFLLKDVPIDELPNSPRMKDIVARYRSGVLPGTQAMRYFESFREELESIVICNKSIIEMIEGAEQ